MKEQMEELYVEGLANHNGHRHAALAAMRGLKRRQTWHGQARLLRRIPCSIKPAGTFQTICLIIIQIYARRISRQTERRMFLFQSCYWLLVLSVIGAFSGCAEMRPKSSHFSSFRIQRYKPDGSIDEFKVNGFVNGEALEQIRRHLLSFRENKNWERSVLSYAPALSIESSSGNYIISGKKIVWSPMSGINAQQLEADWGRNGDLSLIEIINHLR
jgi:hypothetical protein